MPDELQSRYLKLYPLHRCQQCGLEHNSIPHIPIRAYRPDGQAVQVMLAPVEIVGVVEGGIRPGAKIPGHDTPAHILGLVWGPPGSPEGVGRDFLILN